MAAGIALGIYIGPVHGLLTTQLGRAWGSAVWFGTAFLPLCFWTLRKQEMPPALALGVSVFFTALGAGFMWLFNM